jgi:hypothetical protein
LDLVFLGGSELAFRIQFYGRGPKGSNIFAGRPLSGTASLEKRDHAARFPSSALTPAPFANLLLMNPNPAEF